MADTTLSLPSLVLFLGLSFVLFRYVLPKYTSSASSTTQSARAFPGAGAASSARSRPVDVAKVDQVAQMFPQLDRRAIAWELGRNGGSVSATTERVLTRGVLENPPPSYQPPNLDAGTSSSTSASAPNARQQAPGRKQQDLIARYNLSERVGELDGQQEGAEQSGQQQQQRGGESKGKATGWASTKTERAALLAKRRDDMILQARRRMVERQREEKGKGRAVET